ncbi:MULTISPECIES: phage tail protein [Dickeya]|uniref:Phage tail fiber protein n=1 Tax=Dickeya aquatica TaxID=1401087 RepID=A0A375A5M6_9GAMM|nr:MULTISPECIES: phage tail protein [Dickeya]SLM61281.1 Phage tail fiber protein [Dickeya aquatica]
MGTKYFTLLTRIGEARLAEAISKGQPLEIAQMGVGDGGGSLQIPNPMQTKLVNEKRRASINSLSIDPNNTNQIIAEQVIPENEGGFWLREMGLYDIDGNLIAVANCPETYKPELKEGSGRVQTVRMILIVSRTDAITLNFDPTVALATRRYADTLLSDHVAAANPHKQYAPLVSPALSGVPTAPTAVVGTSNSQLATTAFVKGAIEALVASSPEALNTLNELAAALGNNPNFATTMTNALANKQPLDNTLTALSGKSVAALLNYLGLGSAAQRNVGGMPDQIPDMSHFLVGQSGTLGAFRLPSGHLVQFDSGVLNNVGGFTKSYPVPFPNATLVLIGVMYGTLGLRWVATPNTFDRSAANINFVDATTGNGMTGQTVGYLAIGY